MKLVLRPGVHLIYPLVYLLMLRCQAFNIQEILVNEPVTFLCTCSGNRSVVLWSRFIPSKAVIAKCPNQTCQIEHDYQKRFSASGDTSRGNFSMTISSAVYNDAGSYRCTCDGDLVTEVKLKVYVPTVVKAFKGQNTTLPCYGDTRRDAKDVQWKKDGKKLLKYPYVITNETSADRYTMSEEGFLDGNLSLHISSVNLSDAGFYLCLIHDESRDGDPRAVLLKVEERQPEHQPPTTTNILLITVLGLGLVLVLVLLGVIYYVRRYKGPQDRTSTNVGAPVQEENPMIPKTSSTQPIQD